MHVAFHTRGNGVDHWVFEPSFPSFLLPYHTLSLHYGPCHKTTLRPWDFFFDSIYFDRYLRLGRYLEVIMWLFLGDALLALGSISNCGSR